MFRSLFRRPRTIRVPVDKVNFELQQVKVTKQSRPLVARFILTVAVTTVLIQGIKRWDPLGTYAQRDVLQEELERVKRKGQGVGADRYGKHWDEQHSQMKGSQNTPDASATDQPDAIRITVPIWMRRGHARPYTESDPEWKEYVKLQGDSKRLDQIKKQIGHAVIHQAIEHGRNKLELGIVKFTGKVGVALDIVPQIYCPANFEVPCIWLSTNSVSAGWRPLPPQTGARMERVFRPVVLLEASTAAAKVFLYMTYAVTKAKVQEGLGWDTSRHKSIIVVPKLTPRSEEANGAASTEDSKSSVHGVPVFPDLSNGEAMRKMHANVVSSMPYSSAIEHAAFTFNHVRTSRQKLAVSTTVRGTCQVRGVITFFGERGRFKLDVLAYYLPADDVFVGTVHVHGGYIVQDYRAWERLNEKDRKQKLIEETNQEPPTPSNHTKPVEPGSASASNQGTDKNK